MKDFTVGSVVFAPHHVLPRGTVTAPMPPVHPTRGKRPRERKRDGLLTFRLMATVEGWCMIAVVNGLADHVPSVVPQAYWEALEDVT